MVLWLDTETYSAVDLKSAGTPRYAEDPSTEITIAQWAVDDGDVVVEDLTGRQPPSAALLSFLTDDDVRVVIHNSTFDRTVIRHCWDVDIAPARIDDTMVMAMLHGMPGGLDKLGPILGMPADKVKDRRGRQLIMLFCKPRPGGNRVLPSDRPVEWAEFKEYARQDIVAMRELHRRLPKENWKTEHALWCLDQQINDRGFLVDTELAHGAIRAAKRAKDRMAERTLELTDEVVASATQRQQLLDYLNDVMGCDLPDLKAATVRTALVGAELPPDVRELLEIRLSSSKTTIGKYQALLRAVSADGRLRNTLQFAGATRTSRWSGRIFQPQNLARPDMKGDAIECAIVALKDGAEPEVETMRAVGNAVRGSIIAPHGRKLVIADLSNIEGRVLAWLAGEQWKLDAFRDFDEGRGSDLYQVGYARSFGVTPEEATGDKRQIGKVMELGLGFQGSVSAFITFATVYKMDLDAMARNVLAVTPKEQVESARGMYRWAQQKNRTYGLSEDVYVACEILKTSWRKAHAKTVELWAGVEDAFRQAMFTKGAIIRYRDLAFRSEGRYLKVRLPSGRVLYYRDPEVDMKGQLSYMGVNQFTRQWSRVKTYGGKLVENCLAEGTQVVTDRGVLPIETVLETDRLWDGEEFVTHEGLVRNGAQGVSEVFGVWMTDDHQVLTTKGWKNASSCSGHNRAPCGLPDSYQVSRVEREEIALGGGLRLRGGKVDGPVGPEKAKESWYSSLVRMPAKGHHSKETYHTRDVEASGVCGVAGHVGSLPATDAPSMGQLWWARHNRVRAVAGIIRKLLGRRWAELRSWLDVGPGGQRGWVSPWQLSLGHVCRTGEQQEGSSAPSWWHDGSRLCKGERAGCNHRAIPHQRRSAVGEHGGQARLFTQVYDLKNAGPRSRFVVIGNDGQPLIVHNCTQSVARDVMAANMQRINDSGYEIVLSVHDELLTETPDTQDYNATELASMMATIPPWAPGLPLAAAGFETHRYRKG